MIRSSIGALHEKEPVWLVRYTGSGILNKEIIVAFMAKADVDKIRSFLTNKWGDHNETGGTAVSAFGLLSLRVKL